MGILGYFKHIKWFGEEYMVETGIILPTPVMSLFPSEGIN